MKIDVLTLFPEMFGSVLNSSIMKRAHESGAVTFNVRDIRDFTSDRHRTCDDMPYGGGPGMVMKPEPIAAAFDALALDSEIPSVRVYMSPEGEPWSHALAEEFSQFPGIVLLCGHYEGIDERIRGMYIDREVSIGDYVLTGGEIPAMVVIDSVVRLIPGVLGNHESLLQESFGPAGLLDHPHYTRPEEFHGQRVPEVLLSGHHKKIEEWRRLQAVERTLARRPDLIEKNREQLSREERELIAVLMKEQKTSS